MIEMRPNILLRLKVELGYRARVYGLRLAARGWGRSRDSRLPREFENRSLVSLIWGFSGLILLDFILFLDFIGVPFDGKGRAACQFRRRAVVGVMPGFAAAHTEAFPSASLPFFQRDP